MAVWASLWAASWAQENHQPPTGHRFAEYHPALQKLHSDPVNSLPKNRPADQRGAALVSWPLVVKSLVHWRAVVPPASLAPLMSTINKNSYLTGVIKVTKPNNALTKCKSRTSVICFHRLILPKRVMYLKHPPKHLDLLQNEQNERFFGFKRSIRFSFCNQLVACFSFYPSPPVWVLHLRHLPRSSQRRLTSTTCTSLAEGNKGNSWH